MRRLCHHLRGQSAGEGFQGGCASPERDRGERRVLDATGSLFVHVDPRDPNQRKTFIRVFEYVLELPGDVPRSPVGTRAYVRFGHGASPLAVQWYREARQVFLGQFGF